MNTVPRTLHFAEKIKIKICQQTKRISRKTIRQDAMISRLPTDLSCISVKLLKPPRLPEPLTHSQVFDVREESEGKVKPGYKMV